MSDKADDECLALACVVALPPPVSRSQLNHTHNDRSIDPRRCSPTALPPPPPLCEEDEDRMLAAEKAEAVAAAEEEAAEASMRSAGPGSSDGMDGGGGDPEPQPVGEAELRVRMRVCGLFVGGIVSINPPEA